MRETERRGSEKKKESAVGVDRREQRGVGGRTMRRRDIQTNEMWKYKTKQEGRVDTSVTTNIIDKG